MEREGLWLKEGCGRGVCCSCCYCSVRGKVEEEQEKEEEGGGGVEREGLRLEVGAGVVCVAAVAAEGGREEGMKGEKNR